MKELRNDLALQLKKNCVKYFTLCLVVFLSINHSLQASEDTIEGYWLSSSSIIEVKVCDELICAEISHVFVPEGTDPLTILDEKNSNNDLQNRPLVGINLFEPEFYNIRKYTWPYNNINYDNYISYYVGIILFTFWPQL